MDPKAAWKNANDTTLSFAERLYSIEGLIEWIEKGGTINGGMKVPKLMADAARALRRELVLAAAERAGIECIWHDGTAEAGDCWIDDEGHPLMAGYYWWSCQPGCLPDSDPTGPFDTEDEALADARDVCYE